MLAVWPIGRRQHPNLRRRIRWFHDEVAADVLTLFIFGVSWYELRARIPKFLTLA